MTDKLRQELLEKVIEAKKIMINSGANEENLILVSHPGLLDEKEFCELKVFESSYMLKNELCVLNTKVMLPMPGYERSIN